jgi:hypothetical protein
MVILSRLKNKNENLAPYFDIEFKLDHFELN